MQKAHIRHFTPYEQTQLARYGALPEVGDPYTLPADNSTPVEYLTGKAEFCGLVLSVTPDVLIPRIETEELVNKAVTALSHWQTARASSEADQPLRFLDVGTGAGPVPLAVATHFSPAQLTITASEVSAAALEVARTNDSTERVTWLESNLLDKIPPQTFHVITANLPYIPRERIATLDPSVRSHEPHVALDGGPDGLTLIRTFVEQLPPFCLSGTVILMEVDYTHTEADFQWLAPSWQLECIHDQFERQRFVRLEWKE